MVNKTANKVPWGTLIVLAIALVCILAFWYAIGHFIIKFW